MSEDSQSFEKLRTGSPESPRDYKEIVYPFDKYEITIRLSPDDKFIEIVKVKINKDFLSYKEKIASSGYHDVDEFYKE